MKYLLAPEQNSLWLLQNCEEKDHMELKYKDLFKEKLRALGYQYNITEGGYVSADKATIIIANRDPYKGQIKALYQARRQSPQKH
jgi:hypothetical protein